jgi:hypothetical protein
VKDNIVAGGFEVGILALAEQCNTPGFKNNIAHSIEGAGVVAFPNQLF